MNTRKQPCSNCPFRTDCPKGWLGGPRAAQIGSGVIQGDQYFSCHKSNSHNEDGIAIETEKSHYCAGSVLLHVHEGRPNRIYRFIDAEVRGGHLVFSSLEKFINHHT